MMRVSHRKVKGCVVFPNHLTLLGDCFELRADAGNDVGGGTGGYKILTRLVCVVFSALL